MYGVWVNGIVIALGGLLGSALRGGISGRFRETVMHGLALCVALIGIMGAIQTPDIMVVIVAFVAGGLLGEWINLESKLQKLGDLAQAKLSAGDSSFSRGFVTASLLYCVGAMAVVGSLEAGMQGNPQTLLAKSALDGVSAILFASTMGPGVILSAVPVLVYQGAIALAAGWVAPYLPAPVVAQMSAAGSLLILGLGLNMLEALPRPIRVANLLPAMFVPIVYLPVQNWAIGLLKMLG